MKQRPKLEIETWDDAVTAKINPNRRVYLRKSDKGVVMGFVKAGIDNEEKERRKVKGELGRLGIGHSEVLLSEDAIGAIFNCIHHYMKKVDPEKFKEFI